MFKFGKSSNDKRVKDALSDMDTRLLSMKQTRDILTKHIEKTQHELSTETNISVKTAMQNTLTKEQQQLIELKSYIKKIERNSQQNKNGIYLHRKSKTAGEHHTFYHNSSYSANTQQQNNIHQPQSSSISSKQITLWEKPKTFVSQLKAKMLRRKNQNNCKTNIVDYSKSKPEMNVVSMDNTKNDQLLKEDDKTPVVIDKGKQINDLMAQNVALQSKLEQTVNEKDQLKHQLRDNKSEQQKEVRQSLNKINQLNIENKQLKDEINNAKTIMDENESVIQKLKQTIDAKNTKNEQKKMINGLELAVETLHGFLRAKMIKINKLENDKQQLLQDKESVRAQCDAVTERLTKMIHELKKELIDTKKRMSENEIETFEIIKNMVMAKDEEIKTITYEKEQIINDLLAELQRYLTYECPICFVEYKVEDDVFLMDCNHLIDRECALRTFKADMIQKRILPRCPQCLAEKVTTSVTPQQLECIMDIQTMELYWKLSVNLALQKANIFHCPTVDCPFSAEILNDLQRFNCNKCGYSYCTQCKRAYHHNETCDEYKKRKCKEELMNEEQLAKLAKEKGWTQCPKCATYIERAIGCFHMKCGNVQCQTEYCDECGKELDSENWNIHFNPPNKCRLWKNEEDLLNDDEKQDKY